MIEYMNRLSSRYLRPRLSWEKLTPRESEIVLLATRGNLNKQIAESLGIAEQTVKNMLGSVYKRLDIINDRELVYYAMRDGFYQDKCSDELRVTNKT